jgi:hypothetical protein
MVEHEPMVAASERWSLEEMVFQSVKSCVVVGDQAYTS